MQGARGARSEAEQDVLLRLEAIAALLDDPEPSLRDVVFAQPRATLTALFAKDEAGSATAAEEAELDTRIALLARRVRDDAMLRADLLAIDPSSPDADHDLIDRLSHELDGALGESKQGKRHGVLRLFGDAGNTVYRC
jgi:hypothetical protein